MAAKGIPRPTALVLTKEGLLRQLMRVDAEEASRSRIPVMETDYRKRIATHIQNLPTDEARFAQFSTNPFVLMIYTRKHEFSRISEIEAAILPAKAFSSMETSAGKMVEELTLRHYGWDPSPSGMQTTNSVIDGKKVSGDTLCLATLKSGPSCFNDGTSESVADAIVGHCVAWAKDAGKRNIDFTIGTLYGTRKRSTKKDWHILRRVAEKLPQAVKVPPDGRWNCSFEKDGIDVTLTVRIAAR